MWTGRYDRLRTRTLVFRTDALHAAPRRYTGTRPVSILLAHHPVARRPDASAAPAGAPRASRRDARAGCDAAPSAPCSGSVRGLLGDRQHRRRRTRRASPALGLGGLDHDRALHDQREVDGGGVEPVVQEALGDVQRLDADARAASRSREHALVHATARRTAGRTSRQARAQVVGVQDRQPRDVAPAPGRRAAAM